MKNKSPMGSKKELFDEIKYYIHSLKRYECQENKINIILIQSLIRGKLVGRKKIA